MGVILLLYVIGMELSLRTFRLVWRIALVATLVQIGAGVLAVLGLAWLFDWPWPMSRCSASAWRCPAPR